MPIAKFTTVKSLVNSLNRSEKRSFRLYSQRNHNQKDLLFLKLFDLVDSPKEYTEVQIQSKLELKSSGQFANLKRHLVSQILKSLSLVRSTNQLIMESIKLNNYAHMLKERGLYLESESILERIRVLDVSHSDLRTQLFHEGLKIASFPIISHYQDEDLVTLNDRMTELSQQVARGQLVNKLILDIRSLGFSRNLREQQMRNSVLNTSFSTINKKYYSESNEFIKNHCFILFHYANCNIKEAYKCAKSNYKILEEKFSLENYNELRCKYFHYLLIFSYYLKLNSEFQIWRKAFHKFEQIISLKSSKHLSDYTAFISISLSLNYMILRNDYNLLNKIIVKYNEWKMYLPIKSPFKKQFIIYKIAVIHAYKGNYDKAIDYFNNIILSPQEFRKDIVLYARLICSLCHFRLSNFEYVENLLPGIRQAFINSNRVTRTVELMLSFTRRGIKLMNFGMKDEINEFKKRLLKLEKEEFEQESFMYFNYALWLESIKMNIPVDKIEISHL